MKQLTINNLLTKIATHYPITRKYINYIIQFKTKYPYSFNVILFFVSFLAIYNFGKMIGEIGYFITH
jgi:hypothetical protein